MYKFGAHFIYRPDSAVERWEILAASFHPTSAAASAAPARNPSFLSAADSGFPTSLFFSNFYLIRSVACRNCWIDMWWPLCARSGFLWCLSSVQRLGVWLWVWVVQITEPFYAVGRVVESILWLFVVWRMGFVLFCFCCASVVVRFGFQVVTHLAYRNCLNRFYGFICVIVFFLFVAHR